MLPFFGFPWKGCHSYAYKTPFKRVAWGTPRENDIGLVAFKELVYIKSKIWF
jgi:hypothetical protein